MRANRFHVIANLIGKTERAWNRIDHDKWRIHVGGVEANVFQSAHARRKRLARFQIFDSVQFERVSDFAKNSLRRFEPFSRKLVNLAFGAEIRACRNENGKKQRDQDEWRDFM